MFDMHNDLLTIAYVAYLNNNYEPLKQFYEIIKQGNVNYITANLYFMSKEEMINELGPNYYREDVSIVDMFKIAKDTLNKYMPDIHFMYSIEGCDYLDISDLKYLKEAGLNSILLVWNTKSKYGSGVRSDLGLTEEGRLFLLEAMKLNLYLDLSHANENTFKGMIELIKKYNYPFVYASHSNIRSIFEHSRNLYDYQLDLLKEVNGKLGLVSINYFSKDITEYIEHIRYAVSKLGINNVMIASDNMDFIGEEYKKMALLPYQEINNYLRIHLKEYYTDEDINRILYKNSLELFKKEGLL